MAAMRFARYLVVVGALAACASATNDKEKPARPAKEIVTGGARVRGGGLRMDVQIGRPFTQRPMTDGSVTASPNAVVTP
jgi:hypothetical protein